MKYSIGDVIEDEKRSLTITDIVKYKGCVHYKYKCNKCGYDCSGGYRGGKPVEGLPYTGHQLQAMKCGCACCKGSVVVPHINSIRAVCPELSVYFMNDDDLKYTPQSGKRVDMKCPNCGTIKNNILIDSLYRQGFSCPSCSISVPIGERIVYSLLHQLDMDFKKEYMFDSDEKRYDFFVKEYSLIIEVHGRQHYSTISGNWANRDEETNDKHKMEFAINHGIENYIIIDAKKSDFDYIKNSILSSNLTCVLDLSGVDWSAIERDVNSGMTVRDICEYWESHPDATYVDMEKIFHYSEATIVKYLKVGYKMGWCKKRQQKQEYTHMMKSGYTRKTPLADYKNDCRNNSMPIVHMSKNIYFKNARLASEHSEECFGKRIPTSTVRYKSKRNQDFSYVSIEEFNEAHKCGYKCYGTPFDEEALALLSA